MIATLLIVATEIFSVVDTPVIPMSAVKSVEVCTSMASL